MPTTSLINTSTFHTHMEEDITYQSDGVKLIFETSHPYVLDSLSVLYNGVVYTRNNDFFELDDTHFNLVNDKPFPPSPTYPLIIEYRKKL